jgi:integration host factor subunit beta
MIRSQLIAKIASRFPTLASKDTEAAVAVILTAISEELATDGGRVEIRGFGTFTANYRPPRTGRNPRSGASVPVPAKYVPHFKPGRPLRERIAAADVGA